MVKRNAPTPRNESPIQNLYCIKKMRYVESFQMHEIQKPQKKKLMGEQGDKDNLLLKQETGHSRGQNECNA